jgi:hypothetical protein
MNDETTNEQSNSDPSNPRRNGIGTWIVIAVLALLLAGAGVLGYAGWTSGNASVPVSGYIAMALGVIFSLAVGIGLMALLFYSSRKGFDEPPVLVDEPQDDRGDEAPRKTRP